MEQKWIATKFKGIRYREHPTRMHGRQRDKYFNVRFRVQGVSVNEGYGWASDGMSASKAALLMVELKDELRTGEGTGKLSDRQKAADEKREQDKQEKLVTERLATSYCEYFETIYLPLCQDKKKSSLDREVSLHRSWILPSLGRVQVNGISQIHILSVRRNMEKAGLSPRSVQYAFACIRMVMASAIEGGYFHGPNPIKALSKANKPKFDNRRTRFLSHEESDMLLQCLQLKSQEVHDMTLLSLHCGLRAGEIFNLKWGNVDLTHGLVKVQDSKSGKDRTVNMTRAVGKMFKCRNPGNHGDFVFPTKDGNRHNRISKTFERAVNDLGLNAGVTDRRQKLTFHSCRHTCASWLALAGVSLFVIKEILGHANIDMTMRYSHLSPDGMRAAINVMEASLDKSRNSQIIRDEDVVNIL